MVIFSAALLTSTPGCVGLVAHLINAGWGDEVEARYEGLTEKKVAVVCLARSSLYGPSSSSADIAARVEHFLAERVPKITIIPQQEVNEWTDEHDWDQRDYPLLGKGIGADQIVAIDVLSMSLHEGNTLYRGRTDIELRVLDMSCGGKVVYTEVLPQIVFPATNGLHITDVSEGEFRRQFLEWVSAQVAHRFYDYDRTEDFGRDPTFVGF